MSDSMTPRQRWLAALHRRPVDRLPFWPKLGGSYPPAQASPFRDMDLDALHQWVGSDRHVHVASGIREIRRQTACDIRTGGDVQTTLFRTPRGVLTLECRFDKPSQSWHPVRFPVRSREDIERMTEFFLDGRIEPDEAQLDDARRRKAAIGEEAIVADGLGTSPLMYWVEHLAGMENAHFFLADYPAEVEALFDAMHDLMLRKARCLALHSVADMTYITENTSTTVISPEQFRRYCFRHLRDYAQVLCEARRAVVLHMCGHLKDLLPDLNRLPVQAFEAFTSPSLGNTTLLNGRTQCPDKCLIGGTNAMLWTRPAGDIIARVERDLNALPHHRGIVVTSAGVMPPVCRPETIREVGEWVRHYPVRL